MAAFWSAFADLWKTEMGYTSLGYFVFLAACVFLYYLLPKKIRWTALLAASAVFYWSACGWSRRAAAVFVLTIAASWLAGLVLGRLKNRGLLALGILLSAAPLLLIKLDGFVVQGLLHRGGLALIVPLGVSFYTLQIIAYLTDVYRGTVRPQKNPFRYALFISFFPQILQGPIPRYSQLGAQLDEGHGFEEKTFTGGLQLLLWGLFLKFMIADKAGLFVDTVFDGGQALTGVPVALAAVLYGLQLYADFLACTTFAHGAAAMFGIRLAENFRRPFFSASIREFWRRWHISLGTWLRDYVYIPLGGSRCSALRKDLNLVLTFAVSGLWHGGTGRYLVWGLLHAFYQVTGGRTRGLRDRLWTKLGPAAGELRHGFSVFGTFLLVTSGWFLFRSESLSAGLSMFGRLFAGGPSVSLLTLGLDGKDWAVLVISAAVLLAASLLQERGIRLRERISAWPLPLRWALYLAGIAAIWVFGTYGFGFDAQAFIYGGF